MYSSLKLLDIFLIVEMSRSTLQHLKIYFQNRHNVIPLTHWLLMDDPPIDLPELRSMDLGYNDPLSLVPFLHRIRLPSLESLSIHDFSSCPEPDTPKADIVPLPAPPALPPSTPGARPLDCFLAALVAAIPAPELLASLRLTGLDCFGSTSLEHALDYLGPDVRSLYISKCSPEMLEALKSSIGCGDFRWSLEHLTIRGMDTDELMGCLWIRHAILHGRLELVCLERPLSCREVLLEEVDEDCPMYF
jgi:hypothetical protein